VCVLIVHPNVWLHFNFGLLLIAESCDDKGFWRQESLILRRLSKCGLIRWNGERSLVQIPFSR
jgi:hypothetical protein